MVIFHSYVKLPEGRNSEIMSEQFWLRCCLCLQRCCAEQCPLTITYSSNILQVRFFIMFPHRGVVGHIFSGSMAGVYPHLLPIGWPRFGIHAPGASFQEARGAVDGMPKYPQWDVAGNSPNFTMETSSGHMIDHVFGYTMVYRAKKLPPQNEAIQVTLFSRSPFSA